MGQAKSFKSIALVVEDDVLQRELVAVLLDESELSVIQCQSAEQALRVLKKDGRARVDDVHRREAGRQD
jgi:two-component system, cell cycle response regulator CpdR